MKALQVNESLAFERGQDPISAMDIGISNRLKWDRTHPNGSFLPAEEVIQYLKKPILAKYIIKGLRSQPEWTIDYQVKMLNHIIDNGGSCWLSEIRPLRGIPLKTMSRIFNSLYQKGILVREKIGNRTKIHLNIPKEITESLNFERGGSNPLVSMGIGRSNQRIFKNVKEAAQWCYDYPEICTDGFNKEWPTSIEYQSHYSNSGDRGFNLPGVKTLNLVKWIKENLNLEKDLKYTSLKDAKDILDELKRIIKKKVEIKESLNFERGQNPIEAMGIGEISKRVFNTVEEASEWCFNFPQICTEGVLRKWPDKVEYFEYDRYDKGYIIPGVEGLKVVKWIKFNLLLKGEDNITLKQAKDIWDGLKTKIKYISDLNEGLNFERGTDPLKSMNIGLKEKRTFNNVEEAAQWAYLVPELYTGNKIKSWISDINWYKRDHYEGRRIFSILPDGPTGILGAKNIDHIISRLGIVKWFKDNIKLVNEPITLRESKDTLDRLEEIIWEHLSVNESLNFERREDPFKSMNIGLKSKRTFKDVEELAQWAYIFPEVYIDGKIKKWSKDSKWYADSPNFLNSYKPPFILLNLKNIISRLGIIKWFRNNINFEGSDIEGIGVIEAQNILNRLEEIIWEHLDVNESLAFERGGKPLAKMGIGKNYDNPFHNNPDVTNFYKYSLRQDAPVFKQILDVASEILGIEKDKILALDDINLKHSYVGTEDLTYLTPEIGYRIKKGTIEIVNSKGLLLWTLGVDY